MGYEKIGQMMKNTVVDIFMMGILQGSSFGDFCLERSSCKSPN